MSAQDYYSGTAVVVLVEKGYGEGVWRASCPIDCGWHGSEYVKRDEAMDTCAGMAKGHRCLRAPAQEEEQADG